MKSCNSEGILELTRRMLELCVKGEWEAAGAVEAERRAMIDPQAVPGPDDVEHLQHIIDLNAEILRVSSERHAELAGALHDVRAGKRAASTYAQNQD